ncbi:hypothetical protein EVAR_76788_1 [Eumeta japonica]|uniref:Uncharacterized protein n=1 Tax=Eumeta variegata TaxID=151549 RepID=A0A4C1SVL1_EUMVA|nr:hypothetical protein EVAR_76788_1 [Eumeta japonica]
MSCNSHNDGASITWSSAYRMPLTDISFILSPHSYSFGLCRRLSMKRQTLLRQLQIGRSRPDSMKLLEKDIYNLSSAIRKRENVECWLSKKIIWEENRVRRA